MKRRTPQGMIIIFLLAMAILARVLQIPVSGLFRDALVRLVMNGILVLSLIPMLKAGVGINYGLPIGISAGLLGMTIAIEFSLTDIFGFCMALFFSTIVGVVLGYGHSKILDLVKGKEEVAGIFVGFSFVFLMSFFWATAPFKNPQMLWPIGGQGMRPTIGLNGYFGKVLNNLCQIQIGNFILPLGLLLFFAILCLLLHLFFKTKLGIALSAVGENEQFAKLSGVEVGKVRTVAVILSTVLGAVGICVYAQSYGFVELYEAPLMLAFPAASALFLGGGHGDASTITQAIIGTFIFQTIYVFSGPLANQLLVPQVSEIMRSIVTNGVILYALIHEGGRAKA